MQCRMAVEGELPRLAELRWDFCREDDEEMPLVSRDDFLKLCTTFLVGGLKQGDWTYWVAEEDDEIVSHIFVYLIRPVPRPGRLDDRYGYMTNVYTRPAYRNRGIGTALMARVQQWVRERDVAFLIVSPSEESIPFYRRGGFTFETEFMELRLRNE